VATYLWKKTADMGDAIGQSNLGNLYYEGLGVPRDYSKSFELLSKAAAQGDAYSLNYMGLHYWSGYAVRANLNKARGYFKKAIALGNKTAKENLKALNEANKRNGFLSFIFALAGGIGSAFTIGWIYNNITGAEKFPLIPFFAILAVGLIITYKAWRSRANILFLIMLALSVPGWLAVTGVIPEHLRTSQSESASSQATAEATATVTSDALNLRAGPSASDDIIKVLKKGDTLTVTGTAENGWVPVTHGSDSGYVSGEMISVASAGSPGTTNVPSKGVQAAPQQTQTQTQAQTQAFHSDFTGTWKRNDYNNTLTFTANTLISSSQSYSWEFVNVSGNAYRIRSDYNSGTEISIRLDNGNIVISGDSGGGEDNWNGTWVKQ
jgi:uncharacterized protein YraI